VTFDMRILFAHFFVSLELQSAPF